MKGIILAGGRGTRLYPATQVVSKQLLPVFDKPMIYYPLSSLLLAGIREILIISTPGDIPFYEQLLGDGKWLGVEFSYKIQSQPRGLADAFILGAEFIEKEQVCLILGDNVFYGQGFSERLANARDRKSGATIFGYPVRNPRAFGVLEFDNDFNVISIEEKPENPKSKYAVPGLYFYDNQVVEIAKNVKPSSRGEIEITSINNEYIRRNQLHVEILGRGFTWLDTGSPEALLHAGAFVETIQSRQGMYVACLEEIAWRKGFISATQLEQQGEKLSMTEYGQYILSLAAESKI